MAFDRHPRCVLSPTDCGLVSIEVSNFKSYKGTHIIGPFQHFTAIVGPNGSGKSNLMDAISFVCGVKTTHLRASLKVRGERHQIAITKCAAPRLLGSYRCFRITCALFVLQELLYCNRRSEDPFDHPTQGHVSLVFQKPDGAHINFSRLIVMSGSSEHSTFSSRYSINDHVVSMDVFIQELLAVGINTRARNFLVFQVRIARVKMGLNLLNACMLW